MMSTLRWPLAHALFISAVLLALPARADSVAAQLEEVDDLLSEWRIHEAATLAEKLYANLPDVPAVQAMAGRVKFYQSDYAGAVKLLEKAASAFKGADDRSANAALQGGFLELARTTRDLTADFRAVESEHFSFRTRPGKNEILAPYALETLEAAYENVGSDFQWKPKERIVVEVFDSASELASVSTLTEKEIETSGTIAICKFNRLVITSPRALLRGYSWQDTLAHEYIHLVISQKSHNTVGIWLHEGLAKYSESRWQGPAGEGLGLWQESLLSKAVKEDKLITFEQMHPSMAKLPSQKDAALAFAEVFTVVEYLHKGGPACHGKNGCPPGALTGYSVTNALIDRLRQGESDEHALAAVLGASFDSFKREWLKYLRARPNKSVPAAAPQKLQFKKGKQLDDDDRNNDIDEGVGPEVKRFARLGNLLRRAGRPRAAAMEYERAVARAGLTAPMLHNRLASAYLESGDDSKALATLKSVEHTFPEFAQTHIQLGRIHYKRGQWDEARKSYLMANRQNPFNPEIHAALADISMRLNDSAAAEVEKRAFLKLNRTEEQERRKAKDAPPASDMAVLSLETRPWAQLIIDDEDQGLMTPVVELPIKAGKHTLRIKNPALAVDREIPVELKPGEQARLRVDLLTPAQ